MAIVDVAEIHALYDRRVSGGMAHIDVFVIGPADPRPDRHPMMWSDVLGLVAVGANA